MRFRKGNQVRYIGGDIEHRGRTAYVKGTETHKVRNLFPVCGNDDAITEEEFVRIVFLDGKEISVRPQTLIILDPW